jgi:branched-subunit amino acid aminotransferase/4-amino-4-deoxychorismate lyase
MGWSMEPAQGQSWATVDGVTTPLGEARVPVDDLAFQRGWSVFETMELVAGQDPGPHLDRLRTSCEVGRVPGFAPETIRAEVAALLARMDGRAYVRVALTRSGCRVITATPASTARWHAPVRCARGPHVTDPFLPGFVKHGSRMGWEVEVDRLGTDDVLRVRDGRFTEGTRSGIVAVIDGTLWTHPADGSILESTTVARLVEHAEALGVPVRHEGPPARGPWDGLYIASSTRSLAPVVELDGEALSGWDPVGRALADADDAWSGRT